MFTKRASLTSFFVQYLMYCTLNVFEGLRCFFYCTVIRMYIIPSVVNFTNILRAAFAPIFFYQIKLQSQTWIRQNLGKAVLYEKGSRKILMKLTLCLLSGNSEVKVRKSPSVRDRETNRRSDWWKWSGTDKMIVRARQKPKKWSISSLFCWTKVQEGSRNDFSCLFVCNRKFLLTALSVWTIHIVLPWYRFMFFITKAFLLFKALIKDC